MAVAKESNGSKAKPGLSGNKYGVPTNKGQYGVPANKGQYGAPAFPLNLNTAPVSQNGPQFPLINPDAGNIYSPEAASARQSERDFNTLTEQTRQSQQPQQQSQGNPFGTYTYDGRTAEQMVDSEFDPQYAMLKKMRGDATNNYNRVGNEVKSMYGNLAGAIRGDAPEIKDEYQDTSRSIGQAYQNAINNTQQDHKQSNDNNAALARRLGVSAATPANQSDGNNQNSMLVGLMNANKANQQTMTTQLGQGEADYNRSEANISDAAGVNAKADFNGRLQLALQGMNNQELGIKGQEGAARNKYDMDIRNFTQQGQQGLNSAQNEFNKQQSDNTFRTGAADLDQRKFGETVRSNMANEAIRGNATTGPDAAPDAAYRTLKQSASQNYPNDPAAANNAYALVQDAFNRGGGGGSLNNFLDYIQNDFEDTDLGRNFNDRTDRQDLLRLATVFYNQVNGQ